MRGETRKGGCVMRLYEYELIMAWHGIGKSI